MNPLAGARGKLAEARFFLELLRRIENSQPVTTDSLDNEATYFTSALLNACYSVLEHLERQGKRALRAANSQGIPMLVKRLEKEIDSFLDQNGTLYERDEHRADKGCGLRHLSVHHEVVDGKHQEQHHGGWGNGMWGNGMWGAATSTCCLYVDHPTSRERLWIVPRMTVHVQELEELVGHWENRIASLDTPSAATLLDS